MKPSEITIIGAGIAGCSLAYFLAKAGCNITVIERSQQIAAKIDEPNIAIVMPLISHKNDTIGNFYANGFKASIEHIQELNLKTPDWNQCGAVDLNEAHINKTLDDICLDSNIAQKTSYETLPAFYFKAAGYINIDKLKLSQLSAYEAMINLIYNKAALKIKHDANLNHWQILDVSGNIIALSKIVVIANSYDAVSFEQTKDIPLHKIRGQVTYLPERSDLTMDHIICKGGYVTPSFLGYYHVGATYDRENFDLSLNIESHKQNLLPFMDLLNLGSIDYSSLKGRVGIRSATYARRPIIGKVPINKHEFYPNLYVSLAHGSRGLTSSVITAQYLTNLISGNNIYEYSDNLPKLLSAARFLKD